MTLENICVYCGSNSGCLPAYAEAAVAFGQTLAERGIGLVYGGSSVGIMGTLADAVLAQGGRVIGIIPDALVKKEVAHRNLTEQYIVDSMHERKRMMADKSSAFVALPGGAGTMEELFEVWTWAQLGLHTKPCGLLNVAGYYDKLEAFLDHTVSEAFMRPEHRAMLMIERDADALLERFAVYQAPVVSKWIRPGKE